MLTREAAEPAINDPLLALQPEQISPALTLQQLAGDPADALGYQALSAGEVASAHAIALFDTTQSGTARSAFNSQLARRFQESEAASETAVSHGALQALSVLDPAIPPLERSQLLTQAAEGFLSIDQSDAALDAAEQAMLVGAKTPDLLPAQRQQIFQNLQPIANALNDDTFSNQLDDLIRNPYLTPAGILITPQMRNLAEPMDYEAALVDAIAAREAAALQLAERIRFTGGADIGPEQDALGALLLQEERIRSEYYSRMGSQSLTPPQQLWLELDRQSWRALKTRVAMGGFGLSLVPEWESDVNALQLNLAQSAESVDVAVRAMTTILGEPLAQAMLEVEGLQWLALQAELGLYPGAPVENIGERLRVAQLQLAQFGDAPALPVIFDADATLPGYRIQP